MAPTATPAQRVTPRSINPSHHSHGQGSSRDPHYSQALAGSLRCVNFTAVKRVSIRMPTSKPNRILRDALAQRISPAPELKVRPLVNGEPVAVVTSDLPARLFHGWRATIWRSCPLYYVIESMCHRKLHWAKGVIAQSRLKTERLRFCRSRRYPSASHSRNNLRRNLLLLNCRSLDCSGIVTQRAWGPIRKSQTVQV
jgi:hypothetical protein